MQLDTFSIYLETQTLEPPFVPKMRNDDLVVNVVVVV